MDLRLLVAAASKHGSTQEIADRIGDAVARRLSGQGLCVELHSMDLAEVGSTAAYDAVVIGSAVYAGRWLPEAVSRVTANLDDLRRKPVWVFSSGPIGEPPIPRDVPAGPAAIAARVEAREHRVFAGRLDQSSLGLAERSVVRMLRAPYGDFRRWDEIDAWAAQIAGELIDLQRSGLSSADMRTENSGTALSGVRH